MTLECWLPFGYELSDGSISGRPLYCAEQWQILETRGAGRALLVTENLHDRWLLAGLLLPGELHRFSWGTHTLFEISCGPSRTLATVSEPRVTSNASEGLAFAIAMGHTRLIDPESSIRNAIYIEQLGRLLPTSEQAQDMDEAAEVLGFWLTGGLRVSAKSLTELDRILGWADQALVRAVVQAAGLEIDETVQSDAQACAPVGHEPFCLFGRKELESFFREHVIDIVENSARYQALGIDFPSAIVLHGPPGCGKTFAVERLIEYLNWPVFHIEASTIASPYIHETSRKVAEIFDQAIKCAPSALVIDEMEAFLADRESGMGASHHRVEEVAEFLRRIPEAVKNRVLIIGMTNRLEMIDAAIIRRGRIDHVIAVGFPGVDEVASLLEHLLAHLPKDATVDIAELAARLAGRPLSDVSFVVREGARLAARAGATTLAQSFLMAAVNATASRTEVASTQRIGFT